ncbi:TolC family protein [Novosphingobium resinovorum]
MRPHLLAALALLPLTAGCGSVVRSHYAAPAVPVAANWDAGVLGAPQKVGAPWWNEFDDVALTTLVDRVLADNADLAAAGLRLKRAKLSSDLARQALLPSLSASASSDASKALEGGSAWNKSSSATLGVSWEIDLFGRLDAQADAARWEAQATAQDLAETRLALVSTTVQAWWQLAYANEQIALGEQSLAYVRRALELVQRQYDAGAVSASNCATRSRPSRRRSPRKRSWCRPASKRSRPSPRCSPGRITKGRNRRRCLRPTCPPSRRASRPRCSPTAQTLPQPNCACASRSQRATPRWRATTPASA